MYGYQRESGGKEDKLGYEINIHTHTTYKVSNKDLPSSAGNYIQYLIITDNGK